MSDARQLTLAGLEGRLKESGLGELPEGASDLTRREFAFVTFLLGHGQMARAAREAGYSEAAAAAIASETLRKPKVHAFYRRCLAKVANNAEQLVIRVYERSVLWHAKALEAAQEVQEAEAVLVRESTQNGKNAHTLKTYETARDRAMRAEKHYEQMAARTDTLLGGLLGKLKLNVDDGGGLKGVILDDALALELVEQRRRIQAANPAWGPVNRVGSN